MTNAISACALSAAVLTSTLTAAMPSGSAVESNTVRAWALGNSPPTAQSAALTKAPPTGANVVLVLLDDATASDVRTMPNVRRLLTRQGTTFTRAYSALPLCSPARATILSGRYPHNTGVRLNYGPNAGYLGFQDDTTIATYINDDYQTGLFGKYLNGAGGMGSYVPPGWDQFNMTRPSAESSFRSPAMSVNGRIQNFPGREVTELVSAQARDFITSSIASDQPFFAYYALTAPHFARGDHRVDYPNEPKDTTWVPQRFRHTVPRRLPADPSINEADVRDKPRWIRSHPRLTKREMADNKHRYAQRIEALKGVDAEVARLVETLHDAKALANTYIILASDNGFMHGEHRRRGGKLVAYETASHMPLIIRGPGFKPNSTYRHVVGLQDLAPTILTLTGQTADQRVAPMDGISLYQRVTGALKSSPRVQLIEIPTSETQPKWRWRGLVTSSGWKFISHRDTGEFELYNLRTDRYELTNVSSRHPVLVRHFARELRHYVKCQGASCRHH